MSYQQALQTKQNQASGSPIIVEAEKLLEQMKDFTQSVAHRAYQFFEQRGREFGHDLEDWFRAETEMTRRVPVELKEAEKELMVRAEVPGFNAQEIKISVEPKQLFLCGKSERTTGEETEEQVYSEFSANHFLRQLSLPAEVDPAKTTATLKDGVLTVTLTKAEADQPINVEVKTA
jgi:HSP20 family protein